MVSLTCECFTIHVVLFLNVDIKMIAVGYFEGNVLNFICIPYSSNKSCIKMIVGAHYRKPPLSVNNIKL